MVLMASNLPWSWRLSTTAMISSTKPSRPTMALTDLRDWAFSASLRLVREQICSRVKAMGPSHQLARHRSTADTAVAHDTFVSVTFAIDHAGLFDVAPTVDAAGGRIDDFRPGWSIDHAIGQEC